MNDVNSLRELRNYFLEILSKNNITAFKPVDDFATLPGKAFFSSSRWSREIFRQGKGPSSPAKPINKYHVAASDTLDYDLVYRKWLIPECTIEQTESSYMLHVLVSGFDRFVDKEKDRLKQAAMLCSLLFNVDSIPQFKLIQTASDPMMATTDPSRGLNQIDNWKDRIDAVFYFDGIGFIIYKCHVDIPEQWDLKDWFPKGFDGKK